MLNVQENPREFRKIIKTEIAVFLNFPRISWTRVEEKSRDHTKKKGSITKYVKNDLRADYRMGGKLNISRDNSQISGQI